MKKTLVFTIHFKRFVKKTSQKTVFSTHSLKNTANSGKNIVNTSIFSSKGTKMVLNTRFLDEFGVKYLTGSDNDTCAYDTV